MNNKKLPIKEKYEGLFWCKIRKKYHRWSEHIEYYKMKKRSESEKLMDELEPIQDWEDEGGCIQPTKNYNESDVLEKIKRLLKVKKEILKGKK